MLQTYDKILPEVLQATHIQSLTRFSFYLCLHYINQEILALAIYENMLISVVFASPRISTKLSTCSLYIRFSPYKEANRHFPICLGRTAYYDDDVTVELSAKRQPIIIHIRLVYTYIRIVKNCLESNIENSRSILYKIVPI